MIRIEVHARALAQLMRYLVVGVINTSVTLVVIFLCKSIICLNPWLSNAIGYVAGLVNSFVWNKAWVFRSKRRSVPEAVKFIVGFLICYAVQLFVTWFLDTPMNLRSLEWNLGFYTLSGYGLSTFIGMGVYTACNFIYNRLITFK